MQLGRVGSSESRICWARKKRVNIIYFLVRRGERNEMDPMDTDEQDTLNEKKHDIHTKAVSNH